MAKEIIKDNIVEAPTLFVGVGGTGCKIIKTVAEMCKKGEVENINFVGLDTNVNDLSSVANSNAKIYHVQTSNTQTVGNYLDYDQDALRNWFPKNAVLYDKTVSEGAGQVRAISRLALNSAIKTGKIRPLQDAIDDLFRKSGKEMKQAMRCVMVSTASGGTGSGIVLPLAMYIRDYVKNKYPNTSLIVRSLIMLPEALDSVITSSAERESQRRNAYATVKEINAFMMKGSGFFDISDDLKRYADLHMDMTDPGTSDLKSLDLLPFDFCFLLDGQNAEDSTLISLPQYIRQAAQALYEQNIGPMQKQAFSVEDNIIKEMSNPGNYGRNRFGGIGAGVLRYPYETVVEYVAADWAIDSIGGEGEAAKWSRYDNAYIIKHEEEKKKGMAEDEMQSRGDVYTSTMRTSTDNFSKTLRARFLDTADKRMASYFTNLINQMHDCLQTNSAIANARNAANGLAMEIDYTDDSEKGKAVENKDMLRAYEIAIRKHAQKVAESFAESIFLNENKTINETKPFTLEFLLKNAAGDICHPNAARYMLYLVRAELDKRIKEAVSAIEDAEQILAKYQPSADDTGTFDLDFSKTQERNLDELCEAEKTGDNKPSLMERWKGYETIYDALNACFTDYHRAITSFGDATAELAAYKIGIEYVKELCSMYERFYMTFKAKVAKLLRKQDEIVDALKFTKGDSVYNVCCTGQMLKELSAATSKIREDGGMLTSELNGNIFDAVKSNVRFTREIRNAEVVEDDKRIDIFDDIIIGYFEDQVGRDCEALDMNIIKAIEEENRLRVRIQIREDQQAAGEAAEQIFDSVTKGDNIRHIQEVIAMGARLAAPGIQRITNEEAREIKLVAYNKSLNDMREYRMEDLVHNGAAVDTISRYEMHFFNALYNLTPDKLKKFAAPHKTETGMKTAGLYHNAYFNYSRFIGPDSTKNMVISTHIDKRWDSISAMPEMDFGFQAARMMKIHKAMIYALVYRAIRFVKLSAQADLIGKKVYRYENTDERMTDMIVSNGTLCDEFYEILDALYLSSAMVEDIEDLKAKKRQRDEVRNSNYKDTAFAQALGRFKLDGRNIANRQDKKTSLFEIPMVYYNSLPNSQRFFSDLNALIDAVIGVLAEELNRWESGIDAKFMLCQQLQEQVLLFLNNYNEYEELNHGIKASENPVVNLIYRKIKHIYSSTPEPDDFENMLEELKTLRDADLTQTK